MSVDSSDSSIIFQMRAITISREYGSGGGEIARRLAKRRGRGLIDHEAVIRVAQELGVTEAEAAVHDEYAEGLVSRILSSMQAVDPAMYAAGPVSLTTNAHEYHKALEKVVTSAATAGHVVIVGRAAQVILAGQRDVLHVRVVASIEQRVPYVMLREGLDQDAARKRIQTKDRDRVRYLQTQYRVHPADPHLYDLVLNSNIIDLDSIVDLINLAIFAYQKVPRSLPNSSTLYHSWEHIHGITHPHPGCRCWHGHSRYTALRERQNHRELLQNGHAITDSHCRRAYQARYPARAAPITDWRHNGWWPMSLGGPRSRAGRLPGGRYR